MIRLTQDILRLGPLAGVGVHMLMAKYNPDTQYVWIAFNDNKSIVYNDGKKIVYEV